MVWLWGNGTLWTISLTQHWILQVRPPLCLTRTPLFSSLCLDPLATCSFFVFNNRSKKKNERMRMCINHRLSLWSLDRHPLISIKVNLFFSFKGPGFIQYSQLILIVKLCRAVSKACCFKAEFKSWRETVLLCPMICINDPHQDLGFCSVCKTGGQLTQRFERITDTC